MLTWRQLWKESREKCATRLKTKNKKLGNVAFWQSMYAKALQLGEKYIKVLQITYFGRTDPFSLLRRQLLAEYAKVLQPATSIDGTFP